MIAYGTSVVAQKPEATLESEGTATTHTLTKQSSWTRIGPFGIELGRVDYTIKVILRTDDGQTISDQSELFTFTASDIIGVV